MDTAANALVFFYGVLWAAAISGAGRYQAFDTAALFLKASRPRVLRRLWVALIFMTFFPIGWVLYLYEFVVPHDSKVLSIGSAAVSSVSAFAFVRLFHAFAASESQYPRYYTEEEIKDVRDRGKFTGSQSQTFWAHFIPGILYLIVFGALGYVLGHLI